MKKKKKTKTIIRNHVRIVNTLMELDEKVFSDLFGALYLPEEKKMSMSIEIRTFLI